MKKIRQILQSLLLFSLLVPDQVQASTNEWDKIGYEIQTDVVASVGKNAPFWLVGYHIVDNRIYLIFFGFKQPR